MILITWGEVMTQKAAQACATNQALSEMGEVKHSNSQGPQWQHRSGSPGYFVTADGKLQTLLDESGRFVVCKTSEVKGKGFEVVAGPVATLEELGIPPALIDEGEDLLLDDIVARADRGESVSISVLLPPVD